MSDEQQKPETSAGKAMMQYSEQDLQSVGLPSPGALNALSIFCTTMTGTPFLPKSLADKGNPAGTLLAVVLTGREMAMTPMQALRAFWLSPDGRLGMYADAMMACMLRAGIKPQFERLDNEAAILVSTRDGITYRSEFTIDDAKTAGIYQKDRSVWPKYPKAMLKARVIGDTFRTLAPDLGGGQIYTKEEINDMDDAADPREEAEQRADILAHQDDALKLKKKEPASAAAQTVEVTPEPVTTQSATEKEADKPTPGKPADPVTDPKPAALKRSEISEEEKIARSNLRERQLMVIQGIEGAESGHVAKFYLGYFGDKASLPSNAAAFDPILSMLEEALSFEHAKGLLVKDPVKLGSEIRKIADKPSRSGSRPPEPAAEEPSEDPLAAKYGWTGETCNFARAVMKKSGIDEARLDKVLAVFHLQGLPSNEMSMMFLLWLHTAEATSLFKLAKEKGKTMSDAFAIVEQKLGAKVTPGSDSAAVSKAVINSMTEVQSG